MNAQPVLVDADLASGSPAVVVPTFRRPSPVRLTGIELRKTVDTRAGRVLLLGIFALALIGLGWQLTHLDHAPVSFSDWVGAADTGVILLLPVLGILAMTSEWTQRTALTTFTLVPRRGRVLAAKLVAAVALGVVLTLVVTVVAAATTALGGAIDGQPVVWGELHRVVGGTLVAGSLNVLMGAAFGALIGYTPAAVTLFFVAPTAWSVLAGTVLTGDRGEWFDIFVAFGRLSDFQVAGHWLRIGTALLVWIAIPLLLGTLRSLRRNVS
jgi:hypothetical protein